jgi:predicted nucleotidyltransferase
MDVEKDGLISDIIELCYGHGTLLYLTQYGSKLFGTSTENSDDDYYGIFLPNKADLLLGRGCHYLPDNPEVKATLKADGLDIQLFSLQKWLFDLVRQGESNGLDLLFSFSHPDNPIYKNEIFWPYIRSLFYHTDKLVTRLPVDEMKYIQFARSQAAKYGMKGTRYDILERIHQLLQRYVKSHRWKNYRLAHLATEIVSMINNHGLCEIVGVTEDKPMLHLLGKHHDLHITAKEFLRRVEEDMNKYGHRARAAAVNEGVDWKALSHTLRVIAQTEELLETGRVSFPIRRATQIKMVKQGLIPFEAVEAMIEVGFKTLEELDKTSKYRGQWNPLFVEPIIIDMYSTSPHRGYGDGT